MVSVNLNYFINDANQFFFIQNYQRKFFVFFLQYYFIIKINIINNFKLHMQLVYVNIIWLYSSKGISEVTVYPYPKKKFYITERKNWVILT